MIDRTGASNLSFENFFMSASIANILEDDDGYRTELKNQLSSHGFNVKADSKYSEFEETMSDLSWNVGLSILDHHLGDDEQFNGLIAARAVKRNSPNTFVVLYSGRGLPSNKAKVDFQVNKQDPKADAIKIKDEFLKFLLKNAERFKQNQEVEDKEQGRGDIPLKTDNSKNIETFNRLLNDKNWYEKHKGMYVAVVDGKVVDEGKDEELLVSNVKKDSNGKIMIAKVEQDECVQLLSPFHFAMD